MMQGRNDVILNLYIIFIIPLQAEKGKRILLLLMGEASTNSMVEKMFSTYLEKEGFEVFLYEEECQKGVNIEWHDVESIRKRYDVFLYVSNVGNGNYKTNSGLVWSVPFKTEMFIPIPWFAKEIPTVFVSVGYPYHLADVPMISTYINCYCNSQYVIEAVVSKLVGNSEFQGISPVDAFCGKWDTRL